MFAIGPFSAERRTRKQQSNGEVLLGWEPCKAVGVTKDDDGDPAYIIEIYRGGISSLAVEFELRRPEPRGSL